MISELPQTWIWANLFDVCHPTQWKTISISELSESGYPVYGANGTIGFYDKYTHENPTLMITCRGATCGNIHVSVPFSYINGNAMALDGLKEEICGLNYLAYYLQFRRFDDVISGSAQPQITRASLKPVALPLAPPAQQTRIVEKLEELLSYLDAGVAELKAAQRKLAQYRQSLLKAAVEGALTADWRAAQYNYDHLSQPSSPRKRGSIGSAHQGVIDSRFRGNDGQNETGADLLQRILTERRARWEARQLAKFAEQSKTPPKDWQAKYPEPVALNTRDLPVLPEGWIWANMDSIVSSIETGKSFKCEERPPTNEEIGVVKVSAVSWGEYDEQESKTCRDDAWVNADLFIQNGDFLFSRANTIELVGACVIAKQVSKRIMLSDKILRFDLVDPTLDEWLLTLLRSELGRQQIELLASGNQESMRNIGQERIRQIAVPLPPRAEISRLRNVLKQSLAAAHVQEQEVKTILKQSAAQRKNILKAAFGGQLVPQDPDDEPASVLLERIRAERAAPGASGKKRGRTPRTSA